MLTPASAVTLPLGYSRIKTVGSLQELVTMPFTDGTNALCWPRILPGDFHEVVEALLTGEGIVPTDEEQLAGLPLSDAGKIARDILLADLASLRAYDLQPSLDCVRGSPRGEPEGLFHTDVYSWHVDTATVTADTYLCTYAGASSEGLPNEQASAAWTFPRPGPSCCASTAGKIMLASRSTWPTGSTTCTTPRCLDRCPFRSATAIFGASPSIIPAALCRPASIAPR